jgi:hypothetical protein
MSDIGTPETNPAAWTPTPPRERVTRGGTGGILGQQILAALDINRKNVTRIVLEISPEISMLTVESVVFTQRDIGALETVMECWDVTPIASAPRVDSPASTGSN